MKVRNVELPELDGKDPLTVLRKLAQKDIHLVYNSSGFIKELYHRANRDSSDIDPDDFWRMRPLRKILENNQKSGKDPLPLYYKLKRDAHDGYLIEFYESEKEAETKTKAVRTRRRKANETLA